MYCIYHDNIIDNTKKKTLLSITNISLKVLVNNYLIKRIVYTITILSIIQKKKTLLSITIISVKVLIKRVVYIMTILSITQKRKHCYR